MSLKVKITLISEILKREKLPFQIDQGKKTANVIISLYSVQVLKGHNHTFRPVTN
jgi:hypothetical protein